MNRRFAPFCLLLGLAGCGSGSDDGVGGVSASEARALNEVAATLDAQTGTVQDGQDGLNPAAQAAAAADRGRIAPALPANEAGAR
ncbi:hypothetical protein DM806_06935 [Sphingobium lactosutens]|uniref:hypothetical protein n=1 Tax=Sphingobium lactosutens TaxID=522773 RepID=UPI0015C1045C|nr:hypothetical protein [Sphingobium lactosutens]NWK95404.1 hypothetical protein [Sphingobium lactosutens]